jgi:hypothetical protein
MWQFVFSEEGRLFNLQQAADSAVSGTWVFFRREWLKAARLVIKKEFTL